MILKPTIQSNSTDSHFQHVGQRGNKNDDEDTEKMKEDKIESKCKILLTEFEKLNNIYGKQFRSVDCIIICARLRYNLQFSKLVFFFSLTYVIL